MDNKDVFSMFRTSSIVLSIVRTCIVVYIIRLKTICCKF